MTLPAIATSPTAALLPQRPTAPRPMFNALAIAASGLSAQRVRMDVIAQNLANAETTRTAQGGPYHRRIVNLEAIDPQSTAITTATSSSTSTIDPSTGLSSGTASTTTTGIAAAAVAAPSAGVNAPAGSSSMGAALSTPVEMDDATGGVRVASIQEDPSDGPMVYDPGNPNADQNGYVRMPNVNMTDEMIDLMNARRLYEANATVFQVARAMLSKAIDI
jgi:flagellar basal-body rod protein FlgC